MFIDNTIADAIGQINSNRQFTPCYWKPMIAVMNKEEIRIEKLRALVAEYSGPAEFARDRSDPKADKLIDASYISQILNGHRAFGEKAAINMAKRAGLPENYFDAEVAKTEVKETERVDKVIKLLSNADPFELEKIRTFVDTLISLKGLRTGTEKR